VELRCRRRCDGYMETKPIDPKLLRQVLSDKPRYRDAIVEPAPGRSFFKGLCGDWVVHLERYEERTSNSLVGGLLRDNGEYLAIALSFPGKVKSMWDAKKVYDHVLKIDDFVSEMSGYGQISSQIREFKQLIAQKRRHIEEFDIYNREDHKTFNEGVETLRKFGIEYDLSDN